MESKEIILAYEAKMQKSIAFLQEELLNIRAGKASVNILNGVTIESYGSEMPINQVASVTVPDAKTVLIQPWDKNIIAQLEKAIINANIGVTPSNNGEQIRLNIPPLTEERRKALVKQVKAEGESAKVSIRNSRRDSIEAFKKAQKDGMAEDLAKDGEAEIQKITDKYNKLVDQELVNKEKEIMTV